MSTEDQNKCVVTVRRGVDIDSLMEEITSSGSTTEYVPSRAVEMYNEKQDSLRNFDVVLTREEAERLKLDPRIMDVRYGTKAENGIIARPTAIEIPRAHNRTTSISRFYRNWGFVSCAVPSNPWGSTTSITYSHPYTEIGESVDVVIQDSGIEIGHPEWLAQDGVTSRLKQIDWPSAAGLSGLYTQPANHYRDIQGHGTHVAGTVAGRRNGWAKGSDIYAIKILDDPGNEYAISSSFNLIRNWHNNKTNGRPTVVNGSWGYLNFYSNIVSGVYRGTPWTGTAPQSQYGMLQSIYNDYYGDGSLYYHPSRVASVDAEIEECIAAGIIFVSSAGNDAHKIDVPGGLDYDNSFTTSGGSTRYYHRGATPTNLPGVVTVGAIRASSTEYKAVFSCCGPGVSVYAPGENIQSSVPVGSELDTSSATFHEDSLSFKVRKLNGTSMASPQVAGILACLVGSRKHYDGFDCIKWIEKYSYNRVQDTASTNYSDTSSLLGSPPRLIRYPFTSQYPLVIGTDNN